MSIVVGYVPSVEGEAALDTAVKCASLADQRLVVVISTPAKYIQADAVDDVIDALRDRLVAAAVTHEIRHVKRSGDVSDDLVDTARDADADLVVIGLRKQSPLGKLLLGSKAQKVMLDAPCAVMVVKAPAPAVG